MPVRRSLAEPTLLSRPSPFSSSVTLFEAKDVSTVVKEEEVVPATPRRSQRATRSVNISYKDEESENVKSEATSPVLKLESTKKKRKFDSLQETSSSRASPSPKKNKPIRMELDKPHPEPKNWRVVYDEIGEMRKLYVAAVDTMGCASAQLLEKDPKVRISACPSFILLILPSCGF